MKISLFLMPLIKPFLSLFTLFSEIEDLFYSKVSGVTHQILYYFSEIDRDIPVEKIKWLPPA